MVTVHTSETRWAQAARRKWRGRQAPDAYLWPLLLTTAPGDVVLPTGVARKPVVEVIVNHSVWQTECPFCPSAQHASSGDRLFYCANCMNEEAGHKALPVKWPKNHEAIEEQLAARPRRGHRNWEPGETIRDLQRQDREWQEANT